MDKDHTRVLELGLKGEIQNKLRVLGETIYSYGVEKFGNVEVGKEKQKGQGRTEMEIEELRQRALQVRKQWRKSDDPDEKFVLSQLRDIIRSRLALLKKTKRRRRERL